MADDIIIDKGSTTSTVFTIEGQFIGEKAQFEINKFTESLNKSFGAIEKTFQGLGIKNTAFIHSFKGYAEPLGIISSLTKALKEEGTETEHVNQKLQLHEQRLKLVGHAMEDLSKIFTFNVKKLSEANAGWEKYRLMNIMTASEMNRTVGAFERAGAAALLSSKESGSMVAQFKELGLVINSQNKELITTTGKLATVFNVDLGRATQFVARQVNYLNLSNQDLIYLTGQLIPTLKELGVTGEEALQTFEVLGPAMALIYAQGTEKANSFQREMFKTTAVLKSMGLDTKRMTETIAGSLEGNINSMRQAIIVGAMVGKNYSEIMEEMTEHPEKYALSQAQAAEKMAKQFNVHKGMSAAQLSLINTGYMKMMREQTGLSEDMIIKIEHGIIEGKLVTEEMSEKMKEQEKKEKEYRESGREKLDNAFVTQMSSFQKGWKGLKDGFDALWASSLRPILGKFLGILGDIMGKLGGLFSFLASNKVVGTISTVVASLTTIVGLVGFLVSPMFKIRDLFKDIRGEVGIIGKIFSKLNKILPTGGLFGKIRNFFGIGSEVGGAATIKLESAVVEQSLKAGGVLSRFASIGKFLGKLSWFIEPILMIIDVFRTQGDFATKLGTALAGSKTGGLKGAFSGGLRWATIGSAIGSILGAPIFGIGAVPAGIIGGLLGAVLGAVTGGIGGEKIGNVLRNKSGAILGSLIFGLLIPGIGAPLGYLIGSIFDGKGGEAVVNFKTFLGGFLGEVQKPFNDLVVAIEPLIDVFKDIFTSLTDSLEPSLDEVTDVICETFGIKGDDKFKKIGQLFGALLVTLNPLVIALKVFAGVLLMASEETLKARRLLTFDKDKLSKIDKRLADITNAQITLGMIEPSTRTVSTTRASTVTGVSPTSNTNSMQKIGGIFTSSFSSIPNILAGEGNGNMGESIGSFDKIKSGIAMVESSGSGGYAALNKYSTAAGKYQFLIGTAFDLNNKYNLGAPPEALGWGRASAKEKYYEFMKNNPEFQEKLMNAALKDYTNFAVSVKGKGKVTDTDLAMIHFMGPGEWQKWLSAGSPLDFVPGSINMSVGEYQKKSGVKGAIVAAEGALVTQPTITLMGESGPELITPMNKVDNIMTAIIHRAIENAGKVALPSGGGLLNTINSLLEIHKEQLNIQKQMLAQMKSPTSTITAGRNKTMDELIMLKWAYPPLD